LSFVEKCGGVRSREGERRDLASMYRRQSTEPCPPGESYPLHPTNVDGKSHVLWPFSSVERSGNKEKKEKGVALCCLHHRFMYTYI
jgi:hypothetical protein